MEKSIWLTPTTLSPEDNLIFEKTLTPRDGDIPTSGMTLTLARENIRRGQNQNLKTHEGSRYKASRER